MKRKNAYYLAVTLILSSCLAALGSANAQTRFGVRGGANLDRDDLFLGAHFIRHVHHNWIFNPNMEYTFVDNGSLFSINADFHYDFPSTSSTIFWVGSGLGVSHFSVDERDDTDLGLNLLTGVSFSRGPTIPYVQAKVTIYDDTQLLIGGGVTF
jgi:hypothetical protein